jgi:hypothetical protein
MGKAYHKKIDSSCFDWGFTIPKEYIAEFLCNKKLKKGTARPVTIIWDNKKYEAEIRYINRKAGAVYQIRWNSNREFMAKIRKTFIQSYVLIKSDKEIFQNDKKGRKYHRTTMKSGQQEVISIRPVTYNRFEANVFIKVDTGWNSLFERLADANVFGFFKMTIKSI